MKPPPLPEIRPDRGTAARSGAGDLALFAATPIAFGSAAQAKALAVDIHPAAQPGEGGSEPATVHDIGANAPSAVTSAVVPHQVGEGHAPPAHDDHQTFGSANDHAANAPVAHGSSFATYVPAPRHAFVPPGGPASEAAAHDMSSDHAEAGPNEAVTAAIMPAEIAQALDTIKASAASLSGAIAALNDHLPSAVETLDHNVGETLGAAQTVVDAALDHLGTLGGAVVGDLGGAADTLVSSAGATTGALTAAAAGTLGAATHIVDTAVSPVTDMLHDVAGIDPVGGVTTLVSLVSAADAFNIHDNGAGASDTGLSPAMGVSGAVDMLADLHPADVLLGATDHHDSVLGGVLHDDGHLLGLG